MKSMAVMIVKAINMDGKPEIIAVEAIQLVRRVERRVSSEAELFVFKE